jgi:hypothetical protein
MRGLTPPVGTLAGLLVGLWLLAPVALGAAVLVWRLLGWLVRSRRDRRHPERVAVRDQQRQARRLVAEWPLLAQTLRLGYTDQWTRQFRFPAAAFAVDGQAVTATVAAIAGASLADYQRAATYLADTWGCVAVRAEQRGPGLVRLRGLFRDPLLAPAQAELSGQAPASLDAWWLGWAEDARPVLVRLAEVSGMVVAGLAGFGKTMLVAHLLGQLAPSPAVQLVLIDGKGGPDYDQLVPRAWLSAKDDLDQVREVLRRVHRLMADRQAAIARVLGVTDAWHPGPSPEWPLVLVIIDEAHTFFHERKGTAAEVKARFEARPATLDGAGALSTVPESALGLGDAEDGHREPGAAMHPVLQIHRQQPGHAMRRGRQDDLVGRVLGKHLADRPQRMWLAGLPIRVGAQLSQAGQLVGELVAGPPPALFLVPAGPGGQALVGGNEGPDYVAAGRDGQHEQVELAGSGG